MHAQEFERKFFELVFRTNIKLTPHLIAYRLGLPFQEVKKRLDQMAHENVVSLEVDAQGVITYEIPGAERPVRDWILSPKQEAPTPNTPGQWFSGPALEAPAQPKPQEPEDIRFVAAPRAWLWVPLLLLFGLFFIPFLFGLLFFCVADTSGFGLFFLLSIVLLKVACGVGSCGYSYDRRCPRRR